MDSAISLRGITWDHPRGFQPLAASVEPYAAISGARVTWEKRSLKDFGDAPIDTLAESYDLLIIDHPHVGMAAESGCLLALDDWIDAETLATLAAQSAGPSHASYTWEGHQWALAIDAAMQASATRPDLLDAPLPQSWDEVLALGARLAGTAHRAAMPLVPTDCICSFLTLCASMGDPPGRGGRLVGEDVGRAALRWLAEFARVAHPDSLKWNPIRLLDRMSQTDEVAYCPLSFCYTNYARAGYAPHLVRFADIPGVRGSLLGGAGFAVSARCQQPDAACAYGLWLCSAETQRGFYVENGGQPGNGVAWTDDHANAVTSGFFRDTWRTLQNAYVRPRHQGFVTFQAAAGHAIHGFLRDKGAVDALLNDLMRLYRENLPG
jgi:multiple sugar transport system substrate-binding protein